MGVGFIKPKSSIAKRSCFDILKFAKDSTEKNIFAKVPIYLAFSAISFLEVNIVILVSN